MTADLPPLHDVLLDDATVEQLFFDIAHAGQLVGISLKRGGARRGEPGAADLATARQAFIAREVAGLQLRYRFGGEEWWDTLSHTAAGVRLIRISHTRACQYGDDPIESGESTP